MGFGGVYKREFQAQNQLSDLTNKLLIQGGQAKQQAAELEAANLRQQGNLALYEGEQAALLKQREVQNIAGNQEEQYLSSGVFLVGSPLNVVNETRKLGQLEIDSIRARAQAEQNLYYQRAGMTERSGLSDYLQAVGQSSINSAQTKLSQQQQQSAFYRSLFGNVVSGGLSLVRALF